MHEEANSKCDFELKLFLNSQETHSCTKHLGPECLFLASDLSVSTDI